MSSNLYHFMSKGGSYKLKITKWLVLVPTYTLAGFSQFAFTKLSLTWWNNYPYLTVSLIALHSAILLLALWSHFITLFTDPGFVPLEFEGNVLRNATSLGFNKCMKCGSIRPKRAHHCRVCKRCVMHMDHHCPWVGNCVGLFNQKFFILYNLYIVLLSLCDVSVGTVVIYDMYVQYGRNTDLLSLRYGMGIILLTIIFYMLAWVFFVFTLTVLLDQIHSIYRNRTMVEELKKMKIRKKPFLKTLMTVFGSRPSFKWLLPLPMKPSFIGEPLSSIDIVVLSVFDEIESGMVDCDHELQNIDEMLHSSTRSLEEPLHNRPEHNKTPDNFN